MEYDPSSLLTGEKQYDAEAIRSLADGTIITPILPESPPGTTDQQYMVQHVLEGEPRKTVLVPGQAILSLPELPASEEESALEDQGSMESLQIEIPIETAKQKEKRSLDLRRVWYVSPA